MCPAYTLLLLSVLSVQEVKALQCFSCVGSSDEDCNRQGSQHCPKDSDACAIIRGQTNGVMKSCSFKSFCDHAVRDAAKAPGVTIQCCFSNNCNGNSQGSSSQLNASNVRLFASLALGLFLLIVS